MGLTGIKIKAQQDCAPSEACRGELVSLPFSTPMGHLHSLACDPFLHFQSQYLRLRYLLHCLCFCCRISYPDPPASLL